MAKKARATTQDVQRQDTPAGSEQAPFRTRNYVLFGAGLVMITAGWFLLRAGHVTIAPILLVLGYCGVLPLAIILR
jgi:hypothetical protein